MRLGSTRARTAACIVFLAVSLLPALSADASSLSQTKREIAATRAKLSAAIHSDQAVLSILNQVNDRLDAERSLLYAAQNRLTQIDLKMAAEQARLAQLAQTMAARRSLIDARARSLYMLGPIEDIQAVANASSMDQFVGRAGALDSIASYDRRVLDDLTAIANEIKTDQQLLAGQRSEATGIRNEIGERVDTIAGYASIQQQAHSRLAGRIGDLRDELAAEKAEQASILAFIQRNGSVYTGRGGKLGFAWPVPSHHINSPYGPRNGGFHTGIDIQCSYGQAIGASKAGRVLKAGWGGGYGNMVLIDHGNGYSTLYAHQSRLYVSVGQSVRQHQVIGACGSTGNSTGTHLHFEIRINGQYVNPLPYLP
ncbi:MAG: murein hydrolase activator EnvC [Actinomycetota bacterium]